jgi:hypothetical protein
MLIFTLLMKNTQTAFNTSGAVALTFRFNSLPGHAREHGVRLKGSSHLQGGLLLSLSMRLYHEARRQDDLSALVGRERLHQILRLLGQTLTDGRVRNGVSICGNFRTALEKSAFRRPDCAVSSRRTEICWTKGTQLRSSMGMSSR